MADFCLVTVSYGAWDRRPVKHREFGWRDGVKAGPRYDYRTLMFEASIDTTRSGDPR